MHCSLFPIKFKSNAVSIIQLNNQSVNQKQPDGLFLILGV